MWLITRFYGGWLTTSILHFRVKRRGVRLIRDTLPPRPRVRNRILPLPLPQSSTALSRLAEGHDIYRFGETIRVRSVTG